MYLFSLAYNPADSVSWECVSVDPVWMDHVDCAWMSLFPSHIVITLHLSGFSAWWQWWQPHKTFHIKAVPAAADRYIIGISKEQTITFSTCPWILKAWLTATHSAVCSLSLLHVPLVALLYYASAVKGGQQKKDERLKVTKSTDQQRTSHRNRGISSTNKSIHTTLKHP